MVTVQSRFAAKWRDRRRELAGISSRLAFNGPFFGFAGGDLRDAVAQNTEKLVPYTPDQQLCLASVKSLMVSPLYENRHCQVGFEVVDEVHRIWVKLRRYARGPHMMANFRVLGTIDAIRAMLIVCYQNVNLISLSLKHQINLSII